MTSGPARRETCYIWLTGLLRTKLRVVLIDFGVYLSLLGWMATKCVCRLSTLSLSIAEDLHLRFRRVELLRFASIVLVIFHRRCGLLTWPDFHLCLRISVIRFISVGPLGSSTNFASFLSF